MKLYTIIFLLMYATCSYSSAEEVVISPFNREEVKIDSSGNYSFIVSGHFHGDSKNLTGFPANTLLANLDWINESDANIVMSLGDLFLDVTNDIPNYEDCFFSKLNKPMFNAVGNHDITGDTYQDHFGETYFYFLLNNDIHIVFDTELNDGSIKDEQLEMLKEVERLALESPIENVFIYSHRTIWAKSYSDLDLLFQDNTKSILGNNFKSDVLPILQNIEEKSKIFWFSGSLGSAPASFFQYKNDGIQYVATAIRGLPRDAVLIVDVVDGNVSFRTQSFTNKELLPFENYNLDFWLKHQGQEPFNYRLLPLYIKQFFLNPNYWYGIFTMLFISVIIYLRKRKKAVNSQKN